MAKRRWYALRVMGVARRMAAGLAWHPAGGVLASALLLLAPVVPAVVQPACSSGYELLDCGEIPERGCPRERGGTCDDPSCNAVYQCTDGVWEAVESCPAHGGTGGGTATGTAGGGGASGGLGGEGGCTPAVIDHTGEATGCDADLVEVPDCPVEAAESCHPCWTGCLDFFLCTAGGWMLVAFCNDDGQVEILP